MQQNWQIDANRGLSLVITKAISELKGLNHQKNSGGALMDFITD